MYKVFDQYNGLVQQGSFQDIVYETIYTNIPWIIQNYSNSSQKAITESYNQKKNEINKMYIYSAEDLYLITQQVKNLYKNDTPLFDGAEIDENSIVKENGYCSFYLNLYFANKQTINLKMYLTETQTIDNNSNSKSVIIEDNSGIQQLYKIANQGFNRANAIEIIEKLMGNVTQIKDITRGYSINKEKQYYDLNKDDLNALGIYSQGDFVEVAGAIKGIAWNTKDTITGYTIDITDTTKDENYTTADLYFNYGSTERIKLKISVSNKTNTTPQIKIK